jgi:hypothetical protein
MADPAKAELANISPAAEEAQWLCVSFLPSPLFEHQC